MKIVTFCIAVAAMLTLGLGLAHAGTGDALILASAHVGSPDLLQAMMLAPVGASIRGAQRVYANGDVTKILAEMQKAFEDFKTEREAELKGINSKFADVVQTEKVDRINAEITKLQKALDDTNAMMAALKVGGDGDDKPMSAERKEHAVAFNQYFRRGAENGLRELEVKAAMRTDSDPDGGYVTPDQMENQIDRVLSTVSAMRSIARVMPISAGTYKKLVSQGGATGGWVGERQSRTETNTPQLVELSFPAMELYANPAATQTLLDDARVDIGAWLADEVSLTFAEMEGPAYISGSGVNQPRGILSYDTIANASYTWGKLGYVATGVAAALTDATHNGVDALIDLVYAIKQGYRQNAKFLMNRKMQASVRKFKDDNGVYLWQPPITAGQPASLLGYPVVDDDNMSDVGANAFPVAFGDFQRGYLIVDRMGVRVLRDPFTNKPYVNFYTTKRVGGGVQNFEAIKLLKVASS